MFHHHKGRYGYRRMTLALRNEGYGINHKTVRKLMRKMGCLRSKKYPSYKGTYGKVAPNILARNFKANGPNRRAHQGKTERPESGTISNSGHVSRQLKQSVQYMGFTSKTGFFL
ncbi:transposase [Serratia symbiotica]|uniref:Transposase n=1 Tax=Serratia symbiotica TaxID=138074 RepID=A0A7D5SSM2_9GAMM|nr:transposase [Serratia symbiotica]QLH63655.1 transposase [Serratia symbiotica]QTP14044.1 transposase [Serratia symbiotica]